MKTREIKIKYAPLPWQNQFHSCKARFRAVVNGRQTGKTTAGVHEIVRHGLTTSNGVFYWVDLNHKMSLKSLDIFKREYPPTLRRQLGLKIIKNQDQRSIVFEQSGSVISYFTAQNPDALVGDAIDGVVVNEAGLISNPDIWNQCLRPALAVKEGWGVFIGSPRGKNWFYDLFVRGKEGCAKWDADWTYRDQSCASDDEEHVWHSFHNPTHPATSKISLREIEMARLSPGMTEDKFRMEYLAEFPEEESAVFRSFRKCIRGEYRGQIDFESPNPNHTYLIGVDLGKLRDYTVVTVYDRHTKTVVSLDRFNGMPWPIIEKRIEGVYHRYRGRVIADGTGVGDAICASLKTKIPNLETVVLNAQRKVDLVENLVAAIEKQEVFFPPHPQLIQELSDFSYSVSSFGNVRYEGRADDHDDMVISLALALWPLRHKPIQQPTVREARMIRARF